MVKLFNYIIKVDPMGLPFSPNKLQIPLPLVAAGLNLVGNVASGLIGSSAQGRANRTNIALARESRQWQSEESQKARDFSLMMNDRQNRWLSPANQRQLLSEGGYNPYIYGQSYQGQGASIPSSSLASAPDTPRVNPVNPLMGLGEGITQGLGTYSQMLGLGLQSLQVHSNTELQHSEVLGNLSKMLTQTYKDLGRDGFYQLMDKLEPTFKTLNFDSAPAYQLALEQVKNLQSQRYNLDMDSLNKDFMYETNKSWTNREKQVQFERMQASVKNIIQDTALKAQQGELSEGQLRRVASEIAQNFASAFALKKQGDYYEASASQLGIMNKMLDLEFQDKQADFMYNSAVRKYKLDSKNTGDMLGLLKGSISSQSTTQEVESNKILRYGKAITSMVGDIIHVGFSAGKSKSVNSSTFRDETPRSGLYSPSGYRMQGGVLFRDNW